MGHNIGTTKKNKINSFCIINQGENVIASLLLSGDLILESLLDTSLLYHSYISSNSKIVQVLPLLWLFARIKISSVYSYQVLD